jgi:hypothetical protein
MKTTAILLQVLLAKQTLNPYLQEIHKKIAAVIENKSYDWKVMRVTHEGEVKIE